MEGTPWVAHRVWAIDVWDRKTRFMSTFLLVSLDPGAGVGTASAISFRSDATLPTSLNRMIGSLGESPSIPIPDRHELRSAPAGWGRTYRHCRSRGTRAGRDRCTAHRRCTCGPSRRGKSSIRRFLAYELGAGRELRRTRHTWLRQGLYCQSETTGDASRVDCVHFRRSAGQSRRRSVCCW